MTVSIGAYLAAAQQRYLEFGGFMRVDDGLLPPHLRQHAECVLTREEPGLTTLIVIALAASDRLAAGMMDDLTVLANRIVRADRTQVNGVLLLVAAEAVTRERLAAHHQHKLMVGPVQILPWMVDLTRNHLFIHEGPPYGIDPDLVLLASPEPPPLDEAGDDFGDRVEPTLGPAPQPPAARVTMTLLSLIAAVWVAMTILGGSLLSTKQIDWLHAWGAVLRPYMWIDGEFWRLFSAAFVHIGLEHLLINGISLWSVGRAVEALFGSWRMLYIYVVAAVSGSLVSSLLGPPWILSAGASGAIFGLLGAVFWFRLSSPLGDRISWRPLLTILGLNLAFGMALHRFIDNWNHIGGLVGGFAAAFAVGVPPLAGLPLPRLTPAPAIRWLLTSALLATAALYVSGILVVPGPGRDLARAIESFDQGRYAEAERTFQQAVARQPDEPSLRRMLVLALYHQGKCREAQGELNYLVATDPRDPDLAVLREAIRRCLPTGR